MIGMLEKYKLLGSSQTSKSNLKCLYTEIVLGHGHFPIFTSNTYIENLSTQANDISMLLCTVYTVVLQIIILSP